MAKQSGISRVHNRSTLQKLAFCLLHFLVLIVCVWLLHFGGWHLLGTRFGYEWNLIDPSRGNAVLLCAVLYWVRHVVTLFGLLARKVGWSEVLGLVPFFALFEVGFLLVGAGAFRDIPTPYTWLDALAVAMLFGGSYLNSGSEIQRKLWKSRPANKGHCYTEGLFQYSMHINYFGDVVMFTGWALLTASLWTLSLPLLMVFMFTTIQIPGLDTYLAGRYGHEFREYASRTKKLIPFVY